MLVFTCVLLAGLITSLQAGAQSMASGKSFFRCDVPLSGPMSDPERRREIRYDASLNAIHGAAFTVGGGVLGIIKGPDRRWSANNSFDQGIREGLKGASRSARDDASTASDFMLSLSVGILPAASIGAAFARNHDCLETFDMASDWLESFGLTLFLTQSIKQAAGRERPFIEACEAPFRRDARCGTDDRFASFFSGHASLAAAGAGLTCSFSLKREAWGSSTSARVTPCALGVVSALATGALRITADRHWGTDVLVGFATGAIIGYFDTWGPLDLLRFKTRDSAGRISSTGMFLPYAQEGQIGAQLVMVF